jgi:hypothetical protein
MNYFEEALLHTYAAAAALDEHEAQDVHLYESIISQLDKLNIQIQAHESIDPTKADFLESGLDVLIESTRVANGFLRGSSLFRQLAEQLPINDWAEKLPEYLRRSGTRDRASIDAICIARVFVSEAMWLLYTKGDEPRSQSVTELEYVRGKVEAVAVKPEVAASRDAKLGIRIQLADSQMVACDTFLQMVREMQSGEAQSVRNLIRSYMDALEERNFLRADTIVRTISRASVTKSLFEIEASQLESIFETHTALRGVFPEYTDYVKAFAAGKEQEKTLGGRKSLFEEVIDTGHGDAVLADSVRKAVKELESQNDSSKVAWDSLKLAQKLDWVLQKVPQAAKAGRSAGELSQMVARWLQGL